MSMTLGPMEAWPIQLSTSVVTLICFEDRERFYTQEVEMAP